MRKYFWKEREGGKYLCREREESGNSSGKREREGIFCVERGKSEEIFLEREGGKYLCRGWVYSLARIAC